EVAGLHHPAARDLLDHAAVRAAVRMVVVDDGDHRQLEARHVPEGSRAEDERTVAHQANDLLVWPRELHARRGADTRAEVRAVVEEELAAAVGIERSEEHTSELQSPYDLV